jgi:hypothetical protein
MFKPKWARRLDVLVNIVRDRWMNNISDSTPDRKPPARRRRRIYLFATAAALATVGVVLSIPTLRVLMPGGMQGSETVEISYLLPPLITLADAEGKVIERVEVHYRQNGLLGDVIQVEEGPFIKVSLWQRLKGNGQFSANTPRGFTYTSPHGDYEPGPELTNVRAVFRIIPMSRRGMLSTGEHPLEPLSFTSDQLDFVDGKRVWKQGP